VSCTATQPRLYTDNELPCISQTDQEIVETLPAAAPVRDQIRHVAAAGLLTWWSFDRKRMEVVDRL
jgi:hypothetical protein